MKDEKVKAFRFTVGMATCLYKELPSTHPFASHGHCVFSLSLSLSPHHEHEGCGLWLVRVSQRRIELAFVGNVGWLEAFIHDNQREREKQRVCKASDQASFPSKTHGEPGGDDDGDPSLSPSLDEAAGSAWEEISCSILALDIWVQPPDV
ncbi:hypothetical protein BT93_F0502 [Corymbia citriodora subsp. variegata]|nr:hypothetical protein BT93_F0502 [Corymbia citriodora subsp. variegata]KAF8023029.1 hypothetical protein BT93_F0502 [Corymbia citriodora subsp. variegata]